MRLIDAALLVLACLGPLSAADIASEDGPVGCLFNKALCKTTTEWCFDDHAFGRCIQYEEEEDADFHHYDLDRDSLNLLKQELERLIKLGYRWSHFYTQCVLKALLFAFRYQKEYNENLCSPLSDDDSSETYYEENPEAMDPKSVGQVQFTPSVIDPHAEFADEIYLPVSGGQGILENSMTPLDSVKSSPSDIYYNDLRRVLSLRDVDKNKRGQKRYLNEIFGGDDGFENEFPNDYFSYLNEFPGESYENYNFPNGESDRYRIADEDVSESSNYPEVRLKSQDAYDGDVDLSILQNLLSSDRNILKSFSRNYNTPEKFRNGHETKDEVFYPRLANLKRPPLEYYYPEDRQIVYDGYSGQQGNDEFAKGDGEPDGVYTEGGVVYLKDDRKGELNQPDALEEFMNTYSSWGFKRPERLDVKKPGPAFSTNNYAFGNKDEKLGAVVGDGKQSSRSKSKEPAASKKPKQPSKEVLIQPEKKKGGSPMESPSLRRQTTTVQPVREREPESADSEYAYVTFKNKINTWQEGSKLMRKMEDVLNLRQNTFSNIRVDQNDVKFKVEPNRLNLNASEVTKRIDALKDSIQRAIGIEVVSVGVGSPNHLPKSMSLLGGDERQLWILSFLLCGVIGAVVIAGAAFFIIKRHPHGRDKIKNLAQMDSEASKDYQDLCRARMASKTAQDKPEGNVTGHRVTNLAREGDGANHSPSSRSSTSSWSEEPALTNMDISTGHMVLSYMEDHLKNKDRLEQEWIALCAYEAEPCSATIAAKEDNGKKNRYNDVLPYDHARVVLNELSNISGSDYINASTITDHDPRNPAYIATQGPLQQTTADFWQMVWEQGSVVMVMLTRLTENGTTMCHRYWPEEGSELYHIYEVHLVSEHIWCDDYLVRSFYLKNIKTGETRTVTQFHFLSWPENGVPLSTKALLEFRRKVNKSYRGRSCPVVVHCSDGVGRTGTYCLIDMVLNRMAKGAKEIDIAATLEHIRDQRPLMVKTKQQFEFVLMAVAEEVHAILKALPANPNHSPPPVAKDKE